jgi:hypothetical protein
VIIAAEPCQGQQLKLVGVPPPTPPAAALNPLSRLSLACTLDRTAMAPLTDSQIADAKEAFAL